MATSTDLKQRAQTLAAKTDINSIDPQEVGGLFYDMAGYAEDVQRNGGSLGIRKVYASVSAMEADSTSPKDMWGKPMRKGQLCVIYDGTTEGVDNNKIFAFKAPGWEIATQLDAGYATRGELAELDGKNRGYSSPIYPFANNTNADNFAKAIFEIYIDPKYKDSGTALTVLRRRQEGKDWEGIRSEVKIANLSDNRYILNIVKMDYDDKNSKEFISNNDVSLIIDWSKIEEGTGYGLLSSNYRLTDEVYNIENSPIIKNLMNISTLQDSIQDSSNITIGKEIGSGGDIRDNSSCLISELYSMKLNDLIIINKGYTLAIYDSYFNFKKLIGQVDNVINYTSTIDGYFAFVSMISRYNAGNLTVNNKKVNPIGSIELVKLNNDVHRLDSVKNYIGIENNVFDVKPGGTIYDEVSKAIKELYVINSDTNQYNYILQVVRKNQIVQGVSDYGITDLRIGVLNKSNNSLVNFFQISKYNSKGNYDFTNHIQLLSLLNNSTKEIEGYVLIDWDEITDGTGYGKVDIKYKISNICFNLDNQPNIAAIIRTPSDVLTKKDLDPYATKTELAEKANKNDVLLKTNSDELYASKQNTSNSISILEAKQTEQGTTIQEIKTNLQTIKQAVDELESTTPPSELIGGDNVWSGNNTFINPISGVAATKDTHYIRQGEYKNTLNRCIDAADYGFSPAATAEENTLALNNMLEGGNVTINFTKAGIYDVSDTAYIDDNTELNFNKGIIIRKASNFMAIFLNRGALTHSYNEHITIRGLEFQVNNKQSTPSLESPLYGLRGHISFLCVRHLRLYNIKCLDIATPQWGIHICSFYDFIIDDILLKGNKDGVHLGRGELFVIRNGIFETYDDAIALNAHDYPSCNPEVGDIKNGVIENIVDVKKTSTTGYTSRLLLGAWVDWYSGMKVKNGDTVVGSNGYVYRISTGKTDGTEYTSLTEPTIEEFDKTQTDDGGFKWKLYQKDTVYSCNIENITYRNVKHYDTRNCINIEIDESGTYNRSLYPDVIPANYPSVLNLIIDNADCKGSYTVLNFPAKANIEATINGLRNYSKSFNMTSADEILFRRCVFNNCDLRKSSVSLGKNNIAVVRDCIINDSLGGTFNGRLITNANITALPAQPKVGDTVIHNGAIKTYNGSSWN